MSFSFLSPYLNWSALGVVTIAYWAVLSTSAHATSGWTNYDTVVGGYRIHCGDGSVYVRRGQFDSDPKTALFSNVTENWSDAIPYDTPDYVLERNHLVLRLRPIVESQSPPVHYLIRRSDDVVLGPFTEGELSESDLLSSYPKHWKTPLTASDKWNRFWSIAWKLTKFAGFLLLATFMYFLLRVFRSQMPES